MKPRMIQKEVEACSFDECPHEAGWTQCDFCGAHFCAAHAKEIVETLKLSMLVDIYHHFIPESGGNPAIHNPPAPLKVCRKCAQDPRVENARRIYLDTSRQLERAAGVYEAIKKAAKHDH